MSETKQRRSVMGPIDNQPRPSVFSQPVCSGGALTCDSTDFTIHEVVVLPLVPVMPTTVISRDGSP